MFSSGVDYLDTANYEPKDEAKFEYSWQWAYQDKFKQLALWRCWAVVLIRCAMFTPPMRQALLRRNSLFRYCRLQRRPRTTFATNFGGNQIPRNYPARSLFRKWRGKKPIRSVCVKTPTAKHWRTASYRCITKNWNPLLNTSLPQTRPFLDDVWRRLFKSFTCFRRHWHDIHRASRFQDNKLFRWSSLKPCYPIPVLCEIFRHDAIDTYITGVKDGQEKPSLFTAT